MFLDDLAKAKRPVILVGGGAYKARDAVLSFAELYDIPCFRTWNAQDVVTDDMRVYAGTVGTYGGPGRNFGIQNADLLLSLGSRISGRITGGMPETFARGAKRYLVDIDRSVLIAADEQLKGSNVLEQSDVGEYLKTVSSTVVAKTHTRWLAQCREWLFKYDPVRPEMLRGPELHHYGFMRRLSELLPANAIVVSDTGGNTIMMGHCFQSKRGQRIFTSNGNTPMGFAMCGAMGAWFADPTRPVVCIIGDGGMQMNIQELQTIVNYGVKVTVFVINNHALGNTASFQRVNGMQNVACAAPDYVPPDFCHIAAAYDVSSMRLDRQDYIDGIVEHFLDWDHPYIVDVVHHDYCTYEPRISQWDLAIEDAYPFLPRDEFRANMLIEPLPGWEKNV